MVPEANVVVSEISGKNIPRVYSASELNEFIILHPYPANAFALFNAKNDNQQTVRLRFATTLVMFYKWSLIVLFCATAFQGGAHHVHVMGLLRVSHGLPFDY